jgi:hypothetical protein
MVKLDTLPEDEIEKKTQQLKCLYCSKLVSNHQQLKCHVNYYHAKERIKCPIKFCYTFFKTVKEQEAHISNVHNRSKKGSFCVFCRAFLLNWKSVWSHMKRHHKKAIRCSYKFCPSYFKTSDEQKLHIKQVHEQKESKLQCLYCGAWFSKNHLAPHVRLMHKKVAIKCTQLNCKSYFKSKTERQEHMVKVHLVEKKLMKKACFYCGKLCFAYALSNHMYSTHKKIMNRCSYLRCKSFFHTKEELDEHFEEMHTEAERKKKLHCVHCSFKTNKRHSFTQHFSIMHGSEKLQCVLCPESARYFKSKIALNIHINLIHSGFKNSCPHCKKQFKSNNATKNHVQSVKCNTCKTKCLCSGLMKIHRKECRIKNQS